MKKENGKIKNKWFLIASICFYISAIIFFVIKDRSMGVTYLCLGSCFLSLSVADIKKDKK